MPTDREQSRLPVSGRGQFFATRARGETLRNEAESLARGGQVWLDFEGVEGLTSGVADEFLCKLVLGGTFVTVANASETVYEMLTAALARRKIGPFQVAFVGGYADVKAAAGVSGAD